MFVEGLSLQFNSAFLIQTKKKTLTAFRHHLKSARVQNAGVSNTFFSYTHLLSPIPANPFTQVSGTFPSFLFLSYWSTHMQVFPLAS